MSANVIMVSAIVFACWFLGSVVKRLGGQIITNHCGVFGGWVWWWGLLVGVVGAHSPHTLAGSGSAGHVG